MPNFARIYSTATTTKATTTTTTKTTMKSRNLSFSVTYYFPTLAPLIMHRSISALLVELTSLYIGRSSVRESLSC